MPVVLFALYMLFCNILLINLLIALFGFTFSDVQRYSQELWALHRCDLIEEYRDKPSLPPPFNTFIILWRFVKYIYSKHKRQEKSKEKQGQQTDGEFFFYSLLKLRYPK